MTSSTVEGADNPPTKIFFVRVTICGKNKKNVKRMKDERTSATAKKKETQKQRAKRARERERETHTHTHTHTRLDH